MSTTETPRTPPSPPPSPPSPQAATPSPAGPVKGPRRWRWLPRLVAAALLIALIALVLPPVIEWVRYRRAHSITDDAFVETHIVNLAPELVSGRIIRLLVEEND